MCGIVGYAGKRNAIEVLLNGLKTLEYRGYDSAGIAYRTNSRVEIIKANGKIKNLERKVKKGISSHIGIGHTRWATHGKPSEVNAHPHRIGKFTIVHNGIIENYEALKKILKGEKYKFKSDTDSEVICALIDKLYKEKPDILKVLVEVKNLLIGSYALGILCDDEPDCLYAIRKDSPLIVGINDDESFIASDVPAILKYTDKYMIIESNEVIKIDDKVTVYNDKLDSIKKDILTFEGSLTDAEKNGYDHFMLKEIHEEPEAIYNTIHTFLKDGVGGLLKTMPSFKKYKKIAIIGCGSAYHAGIIGKNLIEKYGDIEANTYIASEFRYQKTFMDKNTLAIFISQSGETADTLASLRKVKSMGFNTLAIVNVVGSSLAREADTTIYTKAGPEISVATTKAYTCQLAVLSLISLTIGYEKKLINEKKMNEIITSFYKLPDVLEKVIDFDYKKMCRNLYKKNTCFYIGRGIDYATSLEGALKLKEISYIIALAYPAGELKHGTISLIEKGTNVIALITDKNIASKTISNVKEVKSRGAYVTLIISDNLNEEISVADEVITVPFINDFVCPIITTIPLQLIGYETAKLRGCDIDKPKNLAKSVTVE